MGLSEINEMLSSNKQEEESEGLFQRTSSKRPYLKDPVNVRHPGMREWWGSSKKKALAGTPKKSLLLSLLFSLPLSPLFSFSNRRQPWPWFVRKSHMFLFIVVTLILCADFLLFCGVASGRIIAPDLRFFPPYHVYSFCRISHLAQNGNLGASRVLALLTLAPTRPFTLHVFTSRLSISRVFQWLL